MKALTLEGISKAYKSKAGQSPTPWALKNISFSVEIGESVSFLGPNGAGKSTLMNILAGLITPAQGTISVFNNRPESSKDIIGYLSEFNFLPEFLKPYEFLYLIGSLFSIPKPQLSQRIDFLFDKLIFKDPAKKIGSLSQGNKRKLGVIAALINNPKILILDEPTVYLDFGAKEALYKYLEERKAKGTTIVISSHVFSDIEKVPERIFIIKNGQILNKYNKKALIKENDWEAKIVEEISQ